LLWADPLLDFTGFTNNSIRGVSFYFGEDKVVDLCDRFKLDLIVRAHQMMVIALLFSFLALLLRNILTVFSRMAMVSSVDVNW
jgi:serine/threonine-protein phosphatase PP1 catalytic subunit